MSLVSRVVLFYPDRAAASRSNAGVYLRMRQQQAREQKAATATEKARQNPLLTQDLVIKSKFERCSIVCWPGNPLEY